jgi:hypothetical protein
MKEFETMALAMIYSQLPDKIRKKVMLDILKRCGFQFSLNDLKEQAVEAPIMQMPVYKPKIYCPYCEVVLKEIDEPVTPELKAELFDKHFDNCPVFLVYRKHGKQ